LLLKKNNAKIIFTYPNWKLKALTFSYDDGDVADFKLVEIFNKYNMKATFHIPSSWFKTKPKKRVPEAKVNTLYKGHELSGHGANHIYLTKATEKKVDAEIKTDIAQWKKITGKTITGYAYPFGRFSPQVMAILKQNGLIYSRVVKTDKSFALPKDFLAWHPTAHHNVNIATLVDKYLKFQPKEMSVLLVWGHSYEFTNKNNWHVIEDFCRQMSNKKDIFYATMGEIASYVIACRNVKFSKDSKLLMNNSNKKLYLLVNGKKLTIEPKGELKF
jgi:peptidoglycan/xylan/chitin deacetylase (PgdA/CDA1 family)